MKVLIVDDEKEICLLLSHMLSKMGHETSSAVSLGEGRSKLSKVHPQVVFLDLFLPDGNGLSLIPEVRREAPNIKIIINSAYDGEQERQSAIDAGADYFMSKPFNREMLGKALAHIGVSS